MRGKERNGTNDARSRDKRGPSDSAEHYADERISGYLTSEKTVDLVGRVSGTLQTIAYAPGSRVRQGQVLFVIEPTVYQDNVRQAEAELNTARANLEYAQNNYTRMQEAMKSDAVSRIQVLQAQSNVATSQAAVSNAEAA